MFLVFIFVGVYNNNKFTTIDELNQLAKSTDVVNAKTIPDITYHIAFVCNQVQKSSQEWANSSHDETVQESAQATLPYAGKFLPRVHPPEWIGVPTDMSFLPIDTSFFLLPTGTQTRIIAGIARTPISNATRSPRKNNRHLAPGVTRLSHPGG